MKVLFSFLVVLVVLFFSNQVFSQNLIFEFGGKQYEAAKYDLTTLYTYDQAKNECKNYEEKGQSDWFLPSIDELGAMFSSYEELDKKGKKKFIGFIQNYYWSSSDFEHENYFATCMHFPSYIQERYLKEEAYLRVRCIRVL